MRNFLDENLHLAEFKNRLENSIKRDNKRFIVIVSILSVLVAAAVTLLVIKAVRSKRMDDWFDDDFYDDFDEDDFDDLDDEDTDDFDIEIKPESEPEEEEDSEKEAGK